MTKPLPGHAYHAKTDAMLLYIVKDAGEAAKAMQGWNPEAEGKYADQVNDACTILGYRKRLMAAAQHADKVFMAKAAGNGPCALPTL